MVAVAMGLGGWTGALPTIMVSVGGLAAGLSALVLLIIFLRGRE
jgi:hypothetical protein